MKKSQITEEDVSYWKDFISRATHLIAHTFTIDEVVMEGSLHVHEFGMITCLNTGIVNISTASDSWVIAQNTMFYIPPNVMHTTSFIGECSATTVIIPNRLKNILPAKIGILELSELFHAILGRMTTWNLYEPYTKEQKRMTEVAIDELKNAKDASYFHLPMPTDKRLLTLAKKILKSPEDMSSIETWAKFSGMSLRSFTRHFTEETGLSFTEWRQKVKIYTALKMLSDNQSVSDVSFELGYQNVSTFIAMFKSHIGSSPMEYMKRSKDK